MADDDVKPEPAPAAPAPAKPKTKALANFSERTRMAILIALGVAFADGAFFVLSWLYFNSHKVGAPGVGEIMDLDGLKHARESFALLSAIVGVATFIAERAPREIGHALASLLGLASLAAG